MPLQITLNWQGPYGLASAELRRAFLPPEQPGLYLWTVGAAGADRYQVSYVGETGNISTRMHTHVTSILGGAYYLYDDDHMTRGADPNRRERWVYQPTFRNLLEHFLNDYDRFSKAAVRNLAGYTFFWAVPEPTVTREVRQSIESALIASLQEEKVPIQNDRPSVGPARAWRVEALQHLAQRNQHPRAAGEMRIRNNRITLKVLVDGTLRAAWFNLSRLHKMSFRGPKTESGKMD